MREVSGRSKGPFFVYPEGDSSTVAYYIRPVARDSLPVGHDWVFIRQRGGDAVFFVASDTEVVKLSREALGALWCDAAQYVEAPEAVAS